MSASRLQTAKRCHEVPLFLNLFILFFQNYLTQEESGKATWREPAAEGPAVAAILVGNGVDSGEGEEEEGGGAAGTCSTRADGKKKKKRELILGSFCCKPQITRQLSRRFPRFGPKVKMLSPLWRGFLFIQLVLFFFPSSGSATCLGFFFFLRPRSEPGNIEEEELQHWNEEFD